MDIFILFSMILQLALMLLIKIELVKMQTPHVNIIILNLGSVTVRRLCGFPLGNTTVTTDPKTANDQDDYTIRNWLGFFQGSTSIIDTSMFGQGCYLWFNNR